MNFSTNYAYTGPAYRIYQMSFFVGYPIAVITYIVINKFFPVEGLGIVEELAGEPIEGEIPEDISTSEKGSGVAETKVAKASDM
jgi:NCS1 family nucleobase:cation symporter-1